MNKFFWNLIVTSFLLSISSCSNDKEPKEGKIETGTELQILVDESLFPVVDDEYQVFANRNKRARINMVYKPLQEVLMLFLNDSINISILPRALNEEEADFFKHRNVKVRTIKFAIDGIAIITSKSNPTEKITVGELKTYLSGESTNAPVVVFDNAKSSTVEYLMQNLGVKELKAKNIYALKTSEEVIRYVKNNPDAYGIISVSWIKRPTKTIEEDIEQIKLLAVKNNKGNFVLPTQSSLKTGDYPLTRDLFLIDGQGKGGLATGFTTFLVSELGQRIILKSGLAPDSLPSRQIIIKR